MGKGEKRDEAEVFGVLLLCLGLMAAGRAAGRLCPPADPMVLGQRLTLDPRMLRGETWRLLPGVGPALAERLELARREAGGALERADLGDVPGVGPTHLERWRGLWGVAGNEPVR